jgi:hypothetical protein
MKKIKDNSRDAGCSLERTSESIFALTNDLEFRSKKNIVIEYSDFNRKRHDVLASKIPYSSRFLQLQRLRQNDSTLNEETDSGPTFCAWSFDFYNHRCSQFNELGVKLGRSISYSSQRDLVLFNNYSHFSILRLDSAKKIHFNERVNPYKKGFSSSCGFFSSRFENFAVVSYFGRHSEVFDIEKRTTFNKFDVQNCSYSIGSDNDALFFVNNQVSIFDIRLPFGRNEVSTVQIASPGQKPDTICNSISKQGHSMLLSLDSGFVHYDLRRGNASDLDMVQENLEKLQLLPRPNTNPLSSIMKDFEESGHQNRYSSRTKSWMMNAELGLVADFPGRTLTLHNFSSGKIEKSISFGSEEGDSSQILLDVGVHTGLGRIATLVSSKDNSSIELGIFNMNLQNEETMDLSSIAPDNLGFIGAEGLLLTHGKGHFNVFNLFATNVEDSSDLYNN